ncbi:MAG: hypothetical protein HQL99_02145 [Magnetococcales bacterium]|nr:hypothetical protein [Magnetococcales bacterium]
MRPMTNRADTPPSSPDLREASLIRHEDGSGSFRDPDGSTGRWDNPGERFWHGADGSTGVWRQDGAIQYTDPLHGIRLTILADGSGQMHHADGSHATWDPTGHGEWSTPHGNRGWFQADGSGGVHHPDGSVTLWNDHREEMFITPDGMEFPPSSYEQGDFFGPDALRESFTSSGSASHSETRRDTMRYGADGSGGWLGGAHGELTWDATDLHTLHTPDQAVATWEPTGATTWQRHRVRLWMEPGGLGGWSMADGSRGAHGPDGSCLHETKNGASGGWQDGTGHSGWWDAQGNRGGRDPTGATWSRNADGSGTFADAILSAHWDATGQGVWRGSDGRFTGTWEPDQRRGVWIHADGLPDSWQGEECGEWTHSRHHCEAWETTRFTHLSPNGEIGVLEENGAGSWSNIQGTLHTWNPETGHQVTHADGSWDTLLPDGTYEHHHAADSIRLAPAKERIWPPASIDSPSENDPLPIRAALIRAVTQARQALLEGRLRSVRIRHRLEQSRAGPPRRSLAAEPEPIHDRAAMALSQADAHMQMARIRLDRIAALIRIRRMEHRMRRPQPRIASDHPGASRPDRG